MFENVEVPLHTHAQQNKYKHASVFYGEYRVPLDDSTVDQKMGVLTRMC